MKFNTYNFRKRLRSNYYKLEDMELRKDIESVLMEYPSAKQVNLTTTDIKNLTKCVSHAIKTGSQYDLTVLTRAYAYCKDAAQRVESGKCSFEGLPEDSQQAGLLWAHILSHGANFIENIAVKTPERLERISLRTLAYEDTMKSIDISNIFEDNNTPNCRLQAAGLAHRLAYDSTGEERITWMQKEADNLATAAEEFSSINTGISAKLYSDSAKTEIEIAQSKRGPERKKALETAYEHQSMAFEISDNFDHPFFTERYMRRAEIARQLIELSTGEENLDWTFKAIYDTLCVADRHADAPKVAAKDYSMAGRYYFRAAVSSRGKPADELEFINSAIDTTKKALEINERIKYEKGTAIVNSNIGRYIAWTYNRTQDRQYAKQAKKYFEAAEKYFTAHPEHDNSGYLLHAQRALNWIRALQMQGKPISYAGKEPKETED